MVAEAIINLLTPLVELLRLSFILSIPAFFCALTIRFLNTRLQGKFGWSFAMASFFSTYLVVLALIIVLYFYPLYLGFVESPLTSQPKPPQFELTALDFITAIPSFTFKFLLDAIAFTFLLLPIEFVALFVFDAVKERFSTPNTAGLYAASFAAAFTTVLIILFVFPFAFTGMVYLLYFT